MPPPLIYGSLFDELVLILFIKPLEVHERKTLRSMNYQ